MLIGFGCTVPGVMASRTLPSERDRKMTILLTPFMSCSAKLPIYGFFTAVFFPGRGGLIMVGLYFLGILVGILMALLSKNTMFKGEAVPFVMELPNYRMPGAKNVAHLLWDKAKDFLQRAFTVIFSGHHCGLVPTNLRLPFKRSGRLSGQHPGHDSRPSHPHLCSFGLWRLAGVHGPHRRVYGEGKCGLHAVCPLPRYRNPC